MLALVLMLLPSLSPQVEFAGLRPGETLWELAPAPGAPRAGVEDLFGRVVDAETARPVEGADVELWTEEIDERAGGFRRFHVARTGRDGRFRVPRSLGGALAEKIRITAHGYLPRSTTLNDLVDVQPLFPVPPEPVVVRVVDSEGRPIAGARFTTTSSCSHDVPAFHAETGLDGLAVLEGYGPSDHVPELRLSAPGFGSIEYLWGDDAALAARRGTPFVAMLPRVRPVDVRVLDRAGRPAGGVALRLVAGDGEYVRWTDHAGRIRFESHAGMGGTLYVIGGLGDARRDSTPKLEVGYLATLDRFVPFPVTVRPDGELEGEVPEQAGGGESRLVVERPSELANFAVRGQVLHEDGWYASWTLDEGAERSEPIPLPPEGRATLTWGGSFTGVEFGSRAIEPLRDETLVAVVEPAREWAFPVEAGGGRVTWLQAGDETLFDVPVDTTDARVWVPRDRELVAVVDDGRERRLIRARDLDEDDPHGLLDSRDFSDDSTLVWRAPAPGPHVELRVQDASPDELRVVGAPFPVNVRAVEGDPTGALLVGPAGTPLLVELRGAGLARTWTRCTLPEDGARNAVPLRLAPVALASLEVRGPSGSIVEGLDAEALAALHPGPLDLVVRFADGRRFALVLELRPGADRVLTITP